MYASEGMREQGVDETICDGGNATVGSRVGGACISGDICGISVCMQHWVNGNGFGKQVEEHWDRLRVRAGRHGGVLSSRNTTV